MKIKISFATSGLSNQGPPNVIFNILRYLDYTRFDVSIITLAPEKEISRMDDFKKLPVKIYQAAPNGLRNGLVLGFAFRRILKIIDPDIVHVHCPRSVLLASFIPRHCKRIVTIHNFPELSQIIYGKYKGRLIKYLRLLMTKQIEYRIACSESIAERYNKMYVMTTAIPNGCSFPIWQYNKDEKNNIKEKLGLDLNKKWFLYIGGFVEGKNPSLVVSTFEKCSNMDIGVVLLGDGYLYSELKKHETDRILLPGFRNNTQDYIKACDYYISCSESEGLPNALLECMSAGLPSVLSPIPGHKEVMRISESSIGYCFKEYNVTSVIDAINHVISLKLDEVRKEIQKIYAEKYSAEIMSEKYQDYYCNVFNSVEK